MDGCRPRNRARDKADNIDYMYILKCAENTAFQESSLVVDFKNEHFATDIFTEAMDRTSYDRCICRVVFEDFCDDAPGFNIPGAAAALEIGMIALSVHSMIRQQRDKTKKLEIGIIILAGDVCLVKAVALARDSGLMRASAALAHMLTSHSQARVLETRIASGPLCPHEAKALYLRYRYIAVVEAALIASGSDPRQPRMQVLCAQIGNHLADRGANASTLTAATGMLNISHEPGTARIYQ